MAAVSAGVLCYVSIVAGKHYVCIHFEGSNRSDSEITQGVPVHNILIQKFESVRGSSIQEFNRLPWLQVTVFKKFL
jgi:hypothetical protein